MGDFKSNMTYQEEHEANIFAMELLMPKHLLEKEKFLQRHYIDIFHDEGIDELAEKYRVSVQLMIFRLFHLGYIKL